MDQLPENPLRYLLGFKERKGPRPKLEGSLTSDAGAGVRRWLATSVALTALGAAGAIVIMGWTLALYVPSVAVLDDADVVRGVFDDGDRADLHSCRLSPPDRSGKSFRHG